MKKLLVFLMILFVGVQIVFSQEVSRDTFNVDWSDNIAASVVYNTVLNSLTQNLRRYNYYHVDYGIKRDFRNGWWRNEVRYVTFQNGEYRISLWFNYFYIFYTFSNSQLRSGSGSSWGFPNRSYRPTDSRNFALDVNEVVDIIFLQLLELVQSGPGNMNEADMNMLGFRSGVDFSWLIGIRGRHLKMQVN